MYGGGGGGEEGEGSGILKVTEGGRNMENYARLCNISKSKRHKEVGGNTNRAGTRIKGDRKWEV